MSTPNTTTTPVADATQTQQTAPAQTAEQKKSATPEPSIQHFTPEEIESRVKGALEHFGKQREDKESKKKEADKPATKREESVLYDEKTVETKPEAKKADKPEKTDDKPAEDKPRTRKRREAPDDDVADRLEKSIEKLGDRLKQDDKKPDPTPKLEGKDAAKLRVFEEMAKANEEYAGLPEQFKKFQKLEREYKSKWEKANPGEDFDPADDAHSEFYDKHEPTYDQDDYVDARAELKANERIEKFTKAEQERLEKARREEEVATTLKKATADTANVLAKEVLGKDVDLKALESDDKAAFKFITQATKDANEVISEMTRLATNPNVKFDPTSNKIHGLINERLRSYEDAILEMDDAHRTIREDGVSKEFATLDEFLGMSERQRQRHWTIFLKPEVSKSFFLKDMAAIVKGDIDENEKLFTERASKRTGGTSQNGSGNGNASSTARVQPPSLNGGDRTVAPVAKTDDKSADPFAAMDSYYR